MFKFLGNLCLIIIVMCFVCVIVDKIIYNNQKFLYEIKEGKHHLTSKAGTVMEVSTMFKFNAMGDTSYLKDGEWHVVLRENYN